MSTALLTSVKLVFSKYSHVVCYKQQRSMTRYFAHLIQENLEKILKPIDMGDLDIQTFPCSQHQLNYYYYYYYYYYF